MKRKVQLVALAAALGVLWVVPLQTEPSSSIPISRLRILAESGNLGMPVADDDYYVRPVRAYVTPVRQYVRPVRRTQGERGDVPYPSPRVGG